MNTKELAMNQFTMNNALKTFLLGVSLPMLLLADMSPESPLGVGLVREAAAIVGAPLTPGSVAGVARRTTRRAVVVSSSSAAAASSQQQQQAATAQQAPATPPPAPPAGTAPAVGAIVSTLPAGCVAAPKGGVEYYQCGGVYYRTAFQGNNLVYVVQQP
jgi:hypothetical protein